MEKPPASESSADLAARLAARDESAPQQVYDRYVGRLVALVRGRLSARLAQRVDPEDVAQSAFGSFFRRTAGGEWDLGRGAPLWRLLAAIARNKLLKAAEFHGAQKRSLAREASSAGGGEDWLAAWATSREPDVADAAALADELEAALACLDPLSRQVVELRLADLSLDEVAAQVQRSERTVRRILSAVEAALQRRLAGGDD